MPGGSFQLSGRTCAAAIVFSTFLLSRVSECLVTSYLAEVKLLLRPLFSTYGDSVAIASSVSSSSSAEPEDLLRIELSRSLHTNSLMIRLSSAVGLREGEGEKEWGGGDMVGGWATNDVRDWVIGSASRNA